MSWLKKLLNIYKVAGKETETTQEKEFERKVAANDWINDVMNIDEEDIDEDATAEQIELEELKGFKSETITKESAFELGDTPEETIKKDYLLKIQGLSDMNLTEMLLVYKLQEKGLATDVQFEEKEKMKKYVDGNRKEAESKLMTHLGTHSYLDCVKAFEKWESSERVDAKGEDLFKPERKTGKQYWEKESEHDTPTDKERVEQANGAEEEKGQVGKEASKKVAEEGKSCPECEKPNQFGEMCDKCKREDKEATKKKKPDADKDGVPDWADKHPGKDDKKEATKKKKPDADKDGVPDWADKKPGEDDNEDKKEAELTHSDTCERCKSMYPGVCDTCKKNKEVGTYRKDASEIKSKITKEAALKKIAEVPSRWFVTENAQGEKVIAKRNSPSSTKKSKDEEEDEKLHGKRI